MKKIQTFKLTPLATAITISIVASSLTANYNPDPDHDRDGLTYSEELANLTDAYNPDTDGGGANDGWEVRNGFNPKDPSDDVNVPIDLDSDNDGIPDSLEGTEVIDGDSDQDGLTDTFEAGLPDTDDDGFVDDQTDDNNNGMPDVAESLAASGAYTDFDGDGIPDYLDEDSDNDGVPDKDEYDAWGIPDNLLINLRDMDGDGFINSRDTDADGDGILDGDEFINDPSLPKSVNDNDGDYILNHLDAMDNRPYLPPDPGIDTSSNDMDHDGLSNDEEAQLGTDPLRADTDGGGVTDWWELNTGFNPDDASDDVPPDAGWDHSSDDMDHDGLTNAEEEQYGTDARRADSDDGGVLDDWEIANGFDPLDPSDDANIPTDIDIDNDGVLNEFEGTNVRDADSDGDGASDALEIGLIDADNDGVLDNLSDINSNGMPDVAEAIAVTLVYPDFDGDGIPNYLDIDSDNDGVHDSLEYDTSWVPEGYTGNPLDVDGDGQLNAMDYDSDGDGTLDFDEQRIGDTGKIRNDITHWWDFRSTSMNSLGQVSQLADDDDDGIPNQADASTEGAPDSDGDGIFDAADIDRARVWNRSDDCVLYYCYLVRTYDDDGDGIENDFDWDSNNDGALDFTANQVFHHTDDNDQIPALFDNDDLSAYAPEEPVVTEETIEESTEVTTEVTTEETTEEATEATEATEETAEATEEATEATEEATEVIAEATPEGTAEATTDATPSVTTDSDSDTDATMTSTESETQDSAPATGAASSASNSSGGGGGVLGFWTLMLLCFVRAYQTRSQQLRLQR